MKAATYRMHAGNNLFAISIHAAREGGDAVIPYSKHTITISIHAAREGGDRRRVCSCLCR